ncbi:MAG: serine/threonine protein kinase [Lentisphaeraceae bacterium]|nr:serine/threonine protein kinase [Lentisphaeraceae bacterium]
MKDFESFARQLSGLYDADTSQEESSSPLYEEVLNIETRYTEKSPLAKGGMKTISKVYEVSTGRHVALAELHDDTPEELREPFIREARLTALLEHPNIISIHDIGVSESGNPYFTMDLKVGDTLAFILEKLKAGYSDYSQKYPLDELLNIFLKVCDAVAYAHSRDVIHLDLKPENIQVGKYGEVLVCDWGLGKIVGSDEDSFDSLLINKDLLNNMTMSGHIKGTPGFMAPEQTDENGDKSKLTDIFSLGCILYSILTYDAPFLGSTTEEIIGKTRKGEFKQASEFGSSEIPKSLDAVVSHALASSPEDRYTSVEKLQIDIHKYQKGYSTVAENAGFLKEANLFMKRNLKVCLVAFISISIITFLVTAFVIETRQSYKEAVEAREVAEMYQKRADFVAKQYELERNESDKLLKRLSRVFAEEVELMTKTFIFSQPVKSMNNALKKIEKTLTIEPDNKKAKIDLVYCLFLTQDFESVNELYDPTDTTNADLYPLSKKYAKYVADNGLLPVTRLAELIQNFPRIRRSHLVEKMLAYDEDKRTVGKNYADVVKAILKVWNPDWDMTGFSYDPVKQRVDISNKDIKMLCYKPVASSNKCILRFLKFNALILAGSGVYDLKQISDLKNDFLDIKDTPINNLRPIRNITQLKYLWLRKNQFSPEQLSLIPSRVKIVFR